MSRIPPGRHPNWCSCAGCRENIRQFEAQQWRGVMIGFAALVVLGLIIMAVRAIGHG